jgi:hypothetical protein
VIIITEFDAGDPEATMHALADKILKYRRAVMLLRGRDAGGPSMNRKRAVERALLPCRAEPSEHRKFLS